jgi:hypothetical protein
MSIHHAAQVAAVVTSSLFHIQHYYLHLQLTAVVRYGY